MIKRLFCAACLALSGVVSACSDPSEEDPAIMLPADDIYTALQQGDVQRARQFIEQGQWDHAVMDAEGKYPLEYAVEGGHAEIVSLMLSHGAYIHNTTRDGKSMLQLAREKNHAEVAAVLEQAGLSQ